MIRERIYINKIPAMVWGESSDKVYIFVHGKKSCKEEAEFFATSAAGKCYQVISFDLPEHGERKDKDYPCTASNSVQELYSIYKYAVSKWDSISLFACSLGAYFSLVAFKEVVFKKCIFQSPILDMERLISNMMGWFNVSEKMLEEKGEIPTPIDETLSWDYYQYVKNNRIEKWESPTSIIYGEKDNLTEREVMDHFISRYNADLNVVKNGEHFFQSEQHLKEVNDWIEQNI